MVNQLCKIILGPFTTGLSSIVTNETGGGGGGAIKGQQKRD